MVWPGCMTSMQKQKTRIMRLCFFFSLLLVLSACSTSDKRTTLRDIDVVSKKHTGTASFVKPNSDDEIRQAYAEYLQFAAKDDNSRMAAINRLAELEFELGDRLRKERESLQKANSSDEDEALYNARIDKTIELLTTSLQDYPDARDNDTVLYRLAKAYDQKGDLLSSARTLKQLTSKYPRSRYYVESQFRIGEIAFSTRQYVEAEDAYTEVLTSKKNDIFYEKALFKRGWARYKQEYYLEAVDDFLEAVTNHEFGEYTDIRKSEKDLFNEYFRAIGLSFSYLGGAEPLNDYFKDNSDFKYLYYTYAHVSDIYLKQKRYSDAVSTLEFFVSRYPESADIPLSRLEIIDIWKDSGFTRKIYQAIEDFYRDYNPASKYWLSKKANDRIYKSVARSLRDYILLVSAHFHSKYQASRKNIDFKNASKWYKRYLAHYSSHARKDNVYFLYAELLSEHHNYAEALGYYELTAYDSDIILNKDAAYATIVLTDRLYLGSKSQKTKSAMLNKHLKYARLFSELYPQDKRTQKTVAHAAELAYRSRQYDKAINLADLMPEIASTQLTYNVDIIKAHSYFSLGQYANAESAYLSILGSTHLRSKDRTRILDKVALSVYKQAEAAQKNNDADQAIRHYLRIADIAPASSIAATGLYDAIALNMEHGMWSEAIRNIKQFQQRYPRHKLNRDVTRKLSVAYLKSDQGIMAAREFEKISSFENNAEVRIAALWQAAELYEQKHDYASAIRSYEEFSRKYTRPYPQYLEAMYKLTELYSRQQQAGKTASWQKKILAADKRVTSSLKTARTKFIASTAALGLAEQEKARFEAYRLVIPLKRSLRKKKQAMQKSVRLYGQASVYGIPEITTQATYSIAEIYRHFSKALLESERPRNLNADELEQYEILIEDQAYPFEEKAIEFYEINLARTSDGIYNTWIAKSHQQLVELYPVRYQRVAKLDEYINVLH